MEVVNLLYFRSLWVDLDVITGKVFEEFKFVSFAVERWERGF